MSKAKGRGGYRPGAGGKPLPPGVKKAFQINVSLTDAQAAWLQAAADEASVTRVEIIRRLIDAAMQQGH